jgi:hypothetical protein
LVAIRFKEEKEDARECDGSDHQGEQVGEGFESSRLGQDLFGLGALTQLEEFELFFNGQGVCVIIAQRKGEPPGMRVAKRLGQLLQECGVGLHKPGAVPEWGGFDGPEAKQPVVMRQVLDSLPKESPGLVGLIRSGESFAMEAANLSLNVERNRADEVAFGSGDELELGEMLLEVEHLEMGALPEELQGGEIIHIGPANDALRRIHGGGLYESECQG